MIHPQHVEPSLISILNHSIKSKFLTQMIVFDLLSQSKEKFPALPHIELEKPLTLELLRDLTVFSREITVNKLFRTQLSTIFLYTEDPVVAISKIEDLIQDIDTNLQNIIDEEQTLKNLELLGDEASMSKEARDQINYLFNDNSIIGEIPE